MATEENNSENMFLRRAKAVFNMKSIRYLLLLITAILFVMAVVLIALGYKAYWHYHSYAFFYDSGEMGKYITRSFLSMFIGVFLLVASLLGFYGCIKSSTCAVNVYAFVLSILFIMKLVTVGLAHLVNKEAVWINFDIPVLRIVDADVRDEIEFLQRSMGCCGRLHYTDYVGLEFPNEMSTVEVSIDNHNLVVPASCCINSVVGTSCTEVSPYGCRKLLYNIMEHNVVVIVVVVLIVMIINMLSIIFAVLLARCIREMKSEKALLAWRIQEQTIMAQQAGPSCSNVQTVQDQNEINFNEESEDQQTTSV